MSWHPGMDDTCAVVASFGLRATGEADVVPGGTLNWKFRIETNGGPRFVRKHRAGLAGGRVRDEHRAPGVARLTRLPVVLSPAGNVAAVVDWEMFGVRPRVFEVVRSLSFSMLLREDEGLDAYMGRL